MHFANVTREVTGVTETVCVYFRNAAVSGEEISLRFRSSQVSHSEDFFRSQKLFVVEVAQKFSNTQHTMMRIRFSLIKFEMKGCVGAMASDVGPDLD